jgi:hypothetical protein
MSKRLIQAVEKARHEMLAVDQLKETGLRSPAAIQQSRWGWKGYP